MASLANHHPIYVNAPPYTDRSAGVRALYQLGRLLHATGFHAFVTTDRHESPCPFPVPTLTEAVRREHVEQGCAPVAVYGEVTVGNPLDALVVVRYLLNKSGYLVPGAAAAYGPDDFFLHFDAPHVPAGRESADLFLPVVDRAVYFPPAAGRERSGFVLFAHRAAPAGVELPGWVRPVIRVDPTNPRSHPELADLYRRCRALVVLERTAAIFEALCCGCPVICLAGFHFDEATYQRRFGGAGLVWGWHEEQLASATAGTTDFRRRYDALEQSAGDRVRQCFLHILAEAAHRRARQQEGQLRALAAAAAAADRRVRELDGQVAALTQALERSREAEQRQAALLDRVLRSRSWRLTAPLRYLANGVRRCGL